MTDLIQCITPPWYPGRPLYSKWLGPAAVEDDVERVGLAASVLTFDGKPVEAAVEDFLQPEASDNEGTVATGTDRIDQRPPVQQGLPSATHYTALMDHTVPNTPIPWRLRRENPRTSTCSTFDPKEGHRRAISRSYTLRGGQRTGS